jgi:hypothetical protein
MKKVTFLQGSYMLARVARPSPGGATPIGSGNQTEPNGDFHLFRSNVASSMGVTV